MNLSSRWCVTAVIALGALGCSDPVPPPGQGAFWAHVNSKSPATPGKQCPSGTSLTFDVPAVDQTLIPPQALDGDTYVQKIIDGEDKAEVRCSVKGSSTFTVEGTIKLAGKSFAISQGTIGADKKGTGTVTLRNSGTPGFSNALSAPSQSCVLDAAAASGNAYQVKGGSIWGHFSCAAIQAEPSDECGADGYFVFENCSQ